MGASGRAPPLRVGPRRFAAPPRAEAVKSSYYASHSLELRQALKDALPHDELKRLHEKSALRHFLVVGWQFLLLGLASWVLCRDAPWWAWTLATLVQGFTVFNFTVLLHDNLHRAVFRRHRPGWERFLAWLYAVPSGISASQFTRWHLDHHQELGSSTDDPKRFHLSPKRNARWYKLLYMTPALFFIYFRAARRETATYPEDLQRKIRFERRVTVGFHLAVLAALLLWSPPAALRAYVIPVFFVFPISFTLHRIGQHYWVNPADPANWSTLVRSHPFWNVAFLASNFHLEHHYFPGVPLYNLRRLHVLLQPFYRARGLRAHGYAELLWFWLVRNAPPHAEWGGETAARQPAMTS